MQKPYTLLLFLCVLCTQFQSLSSTLATKSTNKSTSHKLPDFHIDSNWVTASNKRSGAHSADLHIVNIGVFYTKDLLEEMHVEALYGYMQSQIASANLVLENSGLNIRRQLAYFGKYPIDNDPTLKLNAFLNTVFDNSVEDIRVLSTQYGFDYITVLRPMSDPEYCGWAFYDSPYAAMQVGSGCMSSTLGAHEWGHNDGADHDIANTSSTPARAYGRGFNCGGKGTVMSTSHNWLSRHHFYSSPDLFAQGEACGESDKADVVRMLREFQFHNQRLGNRVPDPETMAYVKIVPPSTNTLTEASGKISLVALLVDEADNPVYLDRPAQVEVFTIEASAKANQDYIAVSNVLQFASGQQQKVFEVSVLADADIEASESFSVGLRHGDIVTPTGEMIDLFIQANEVTVDTSVAFAESELSINAGESFDITLQRQGSLTGSLLARLSSDVNWLKFDNTLVEMAAGVSTVKVPVTVMENAGTYAEILLVMPHAFLGKQQTLSLNVNLGAGGGSDQSAKEGGAMLALLGLLLMTFYLRVIRLYDISYAD